jgi:DNA invertase Pin-like site-specific DNA recombinase
MYIFGYLRASTKEQDARRAQNRMQSFIEGLGHRVAGWYIENASGASLQRTELIRLLDDMAPGDVLLVEQVDRLSRLADADWATLKKLIAEKQLSVVSLDLPTSQMALTQSNVDDFTRAMLQAVNAMMLDMLAAIARKDYLDRRRRQAEGIEKSRQAGKFRGRRPDESKHQLVIELRRNGKSIAETARLAGVSASTVNRIKRNHDNLP